MDATIRSPSHRHSGSTDGSCAVARFVRTPGSAPQRPAAHSKSGKSVVVTLGAENSAARQTWAALPQSSSRSVGLVKIAGRGQKSRRWPGCHQRGPIPRAWAERELGLGLLDWAPHGSRAERALCHYRCNASSTVAAVDRRIPCWVGWQYLSRWLHIDGQEIFQGQTTQNFPFQNS